MNILLPLIAIFLTSISLELISKKSKISIWLGVRSLVRSLKLFEVETCFKTHYSNIDYAVSPENNSSGIVASFNNFSTISRGMGLLVQTPQELITPSILQIKLTNKTV